MANESPASVLFSRDGYDVVTTDGYSIAVNQPGIIIAGKDGGNVRFIAVNSNGQSIIVGSGIAGTPSGGILSVQGVVGGTAIPVSGSLSSPDIVATGIITANGQSVITLDLNGIGTAAIQITGTWSGTLQFEGSVDGTNFVNINVRGTNTNTISTNTTANGLFRVGISGLRNIRVRASAFSSGTATITIRQSSEVASVYLHESIPTGNATIGAVTGSGNFNVVGPGASGAAVSGNPVRIGASDGTNTRNILSDTSGRLIVVGAGASGAAVVGNPVLIAGSDGTNTRNLLTANDGTLRIDPTGTTTQPISAASLPLPIGAATESTLNTISTKLPTSLVGGRFDVNVGSWLNSTAPTVGQKSMTSSLPVVIASDQSAINIAGTVTSNIGTTNGLALDSSLTGGSQRTKITDGTNDGYVMNSAPIGTEYGLIVRNIPSGTQTISGSVTATVSGTVTANQGAAQSLSNPWPVQLSNGSVTPIITNTTPGGSDQALVVRNIPSGTQTVSGTVTANAGTGTFSVAGTGTAGVPAGGVLTVQGSSGMTALSTGGTVNTVPPVWLDNQLRPFSLTLSGRLRIDGSEVIQPARITDGYNSPSIINSAPTGSEYGLVVRNIPYGTQDVSGTITVNAGTGNFNNSSIRAIGNSVPGFASYVGFSDGINIQGARVFDLDTTAGTQYVMGVNLRLSSGGGSVEFGTASNPIRIDPTGGTIQPVSGTITAHQGNAGVASWKFVLNDGLNEVAIKDPSTAAVASDSALVVAVSPNNNVSVVGPGASGAALSGNPVRVAGSDGTNTRNITTDTSGRLITVGAAASGAAATGNPVLVAGSDGTNARSLRTATDGTLRIDPTGTTTQPVSGTVTVTQATASNLNAQVVGPGASGAALSGNPVRVGGSDGTNTRNILTDTSGRIVVAGPGAVDSPILGNPVIIGQNDGYNNTVIPVAFDLDSGVGTQYVAGVNLRFSSSGGSVEAGTTSNPINVTGTITTNETGGTSPTFYVVFDRITPATNKYMATLFNTSSTKKLVVYRVSRFNWQVASVTGQTLDQYLARITARTAGTSVDIRAADSSDILPAGVTADTNSTPVTEDHIIRRFFASSEEANLSNANFYNAISLDYSVAIYERVIGTRGLVLRQNQGLTIRNVTNSTAGSVSYLIEFVVEDV